MRNDLYINKLKNDSKIYRDDFEFLYSELKTRNLVLMGLRQVGKTTLAEQLALRYYNEFASPLPIEETILYLNVKTFEKSVFTGINKFLIDLIFSKKWKIIIIDEIQMIENWSSIMQAIIDLDKSKRYIMTGSNTISLTKEIAVNRFKSYYINTLSFNEARKFWPDISFERYLQCGSFPKSKEYETPEMQYIETIKTNVIDKVIFYDSESMVNQNKFYALLSDIKNYVGNEFNKNVSALKASISRFTIDEYVMLMSFSRLIQFVPKYSDKNTYTKNKIYFNDKSMIYFFNNDEKMNNNDYGALIENLVFNHLDTLFNKEFMWNQIFYFKEKSEIDFIIPKEKLLIEVKYRTGNIDWYELTDNIDSILPDDIQDFRKIIVSKDVDTIIGNWEIIPLEKFLQIKDFKYTEEQKKLLNFIRAK